MFIKYFVAIYHWSTSQFEIWSKIFLDAMYEPQ